METINYACDYCIYHCRATVNISFGTPKRLVCLADMPHSEWVVDPPLNKVVEDRQPKCCKDMKPIKYSEQICPICGRHVPAAT